MIGGRYGLGSKEFTPAMAASVFAELGRARAEAPVHGRHRRRRHPPQPRRRRLVRDPGPVDGTAIFFALGSDGTVGANKESVKIIGSQTGLHAQGYFVYDSKKSGSMTVSHLRFGPDPIRSTYLIEQADFVACHHFGLLERFDVLETAKPGATFLLNAPYPASEVWHHLPARGPSRDSRPQHPLRHDRRRPDRPPGRHGGAHQHRDAAVLLRALRRDADRRSHRCHQAVDREGLRHGAGASIVERNLAAVDAALQAMEEVTVPLDDLDDVESPPVGTPMAATATSSSA